MGFIPDDQFYLPEEKKIDTAAGGPQTPPVKLIKDDDFYAVPKDSMPSLGTATLYGAARNIVPSIAGLISGTVSGIAGGVAGGPAAAYTAPVAAFAGSTAGAYGTAKAQEAIWKPGLREQLAAADSPNAYSWAGLIPGFATGKFIDPKALATGGLKAGANAAQVATANAVKKAARIELATEVGGELGGDLVINALTGQEQNVGQSVGMALTEGLLQGQQTRVGRAIAQSPINLAEYLTTPSAPKPATPVTPAIQSNILAEARGAGAVDPNAPIPLGPDGLPVATQGQIAAQNVPAATVATPAVATPAVATPAVATPAVATPAAATPAVATPAAAATPAAPAAPVARPSVQPGTTAAVTVAADGRGQVTSIPDHIPAHETLPLEQLRAAHGAMEPAQAANSIIGLNAEAHRRNGSNKPADPAFVERILTHTGVALRDIATKDQGLAISTGEGVSRMLEKQILNARNNPDQTPYTPEQVFEMEYRKGRIDAIVDHIRKGGREPIAYSVAGAAEYVRNMKHYAGKDAEVEAARNTPPTPEQATAEGNLDIGEVPVTFNTKRWQADANAPNGGSVVQDQGQAPMVEYNGRLIVLRNVNGVQVPFYLSTGDGGKKDVPSGKWYPFFGVAEGWLNKTGGKEMASYYGREDLATVARQLDRTIGDIRHQAGRDKFPKVGNKESFAHINQGLTPAENGTPETRQKLEANMKNLFDRLDAAAAQRKPKPVAAQPDNPETGRPQNPGNHEQKLKDAGYTKFEDGYMNPEGDYKIVIKGNKATAVSLDDTYDMQGKPMYKAGETISYVGGVHTLDEIDSLISSLSGFKRSASWVSKENGRSHQTTDKHGLIVNQGDNFMVQRASAFKKDGSPQSYETLGFTKTLEDAKKLFADKQEGRQKEKALERRQQEAARQRKQQEAKPAPKPAAPASTELTPDAEQNPTSLEDLKANHEQKKAEFEEAREKLKKMIPGIIVFKDGWERKAKKHSKEAAALIDEIKAKFKSKVKAYNDLSDHPEHKAESRRKGEEILRQLQAKEDAAKKKKEAKPLTKKEQKAADKKAKEEKEAADHVEKNVSEYAEENPDAPKEVVEALRVIMSRERFGIITQEVFDAYKIFDAYERSTSENAQLVMSHPGIESYRGFNVKVGEEQQNGGVIKLKEGYTLDFSEGSGLEFSVHDDGRTFSSEKGEIYPNNDSDATRYLGNIIKKSEADQFAAQNFIEREKSRRGNDDPEVLELIAEYEKKYGKYEVRPENEYDKARRRKAEPRDDFDETEDPDPDEDPEDVAEREALWKESNDQNEKEAEQRDAAKTDEQIYEEQMAEQKKDFEKGSEKSISSAEKRLKDAETQLEKANNSGKVKPAQMEKLTRAVQVAKDELAYLTDPGHKHPAFRWFEKMNALGFKMERKSGLRITSQTSFLDPTGEFSIIPHLKPKGGIESYGVSRVDRSGEYEQHVDSKFFKTAEDAIDYIAKQTGEKAAPAAKPNPRDGVAINGTPEGDAVIEEMKNVLKAKGFELVQKYGGKPNWSSKDLHQDFKHPEGKFQIGYGMNKYTVKDNAVNSHVQTFDTLDEAVRFMEKLNDVYNGVSRYSSEGPDSEIGYYVDDDFVAHGRESYADSTFLSDLKALKDMGIDIDYIVQSLDHELTSDDEFGLRSIWTTLIDGKNTGAPKDIDQDSEEQTEKPKQLGAGVQRGELFDSSDDFSLAGDRAAPPPTEGTADTTGDFSTGAEPVHIVDAREQLSKLEKSGRNPDQQAALRRTIADYNESVKPKSEGEQNKPKLKVTRLLMELDKLAVAGEEGRFLGSENEAAITNKIIDLREAGASLDDILNKFGLKKGVGIDAGEVQHIYEKSKKRVSEPVKPSQEPPGEDARVFTAEVKQTMRNLQFKQEIGSDKKPVFKSPDGFDEIWPDTDASGNISAWYFRGWRTKKVLRFKNFDDAMSRTKYADKSGPTAGKNGERNKGRIDFEGFEYPPEDHASRVAYFKEDVEGYLKRVNKNRKAGDQVTVEQAISSVSTSGKAFPDYREPGGLNHKAMLAIKEAFGFPADHKFEVSAYDTEGQLKSRLDPRHFKPRIKDAEERRAAAYRERVENDKVAKGILDHDQTARGIGNLVLIRPTAEIAEEMNVGIKNVSRLMQQLVRENILSASKGTKVNTANGSYTTTYSLEKGVSVEQYQARLREIAGIKPVAQVQVVAKRTELKGLRGFKRGIEDMRELLADSQNDDVRKHRQGNVEKMEAILSATRPKTRDSSRIETQRKKLKALLDGTAFSANRASGLAFAENPDVIEIMDRIRSYEGLQVTSVTDAEAVLKPAVEGEPASITEARQQLSRIIKNMSRGEGWDAKKAEAQAKIEQFELESKLLSGEHNPTQEEIDIISNAALEEFVSRFGSGDVDPAITTKVEDELAARLQLQEQEGVKETGEDEPKYGDLLADIKSLMAEHGDKYGIPTLPAVFEAESLNTLREQLSPQQAKELMRHPKGMGAVDANRAKNDRTYRIEMRNQAEGQISQLATALSELGWTQFDPTTTNSDELIQAIVAAGRGELQAPKGGVLGAAAKIDKRAQGIVDRLYQVDQANPDDPFLVRDEPFEAKADRDEHAKAVVTAMRAVQNKVMTTKDAVELIIKAVGNSNNVRVKEAIAVLKQIASSKVKNLQVKFSDIYATDKNGMDIGGVFNDDAGIIEISIPSIIKSSKSGAFAVEALGHEIVHYHTVRAVKHNIDFKTDVRGVMNTAKKWMEENGITPNQYGMNNEMEFLAEGMTNQKFRNLLKRIPANKGITGPDSNTKINLFTKLVAKIKAVLSKVGINFESNTALERVIELYSKAKTDFNEGDELAFIGETRWSHRKRQNWPETSLLRRNALSVGGSYRQIKEGDVVPDELPADLEQRASGFIGDPPSQAVSRDRADQARDDASKKPFSYPNTKKFNDWTKGNQYGFKPRSTMPMLVRGLEKLNNFNALVDGFVTTVFHGTKSEGRGFDQFKPGSLTYFVADRDAAGMYAKDAPDMYYVRSTAPAVLTHPNAAIQAFESSGTETQQGRIGKDLIDFYNNVASESFDSIDSFISALEDGRLFDIDGRSQAGIQHKMSRWFLEDATYKYDSVVFKDSTVSSESPTIVVSNDGHPKLGRNPNTSVKAASNFGGFSSEDPRFNFSKKKQGEFDMPVSGEVRLQDAMGVKGKNKLSEADFDRLTSEDPSFNPREWQSVLEEGHFDSKGPDARLIGKRVYKRIALPGMVDPSAEATAQDSLPKNDVSNSGDGQTLALVRKASEEQSDDPDVFKNPRSGQSVARTAWDIVSGRYLSGISGKAHQNAARHPDSEAVKAIANMIHSRPGTQSNSYERDIPTAISVARTKYQTRLNKIMEPLRATLGAFKDTEDGTAKAQREEIYQALTDMITGRKPFTAGAIGDTARGLKALLADLHEHRKDAGEALGEVENYFPAVYDSPRIGESRKPFINDAKKAYEIELAKLDEQELARELGITKAELADLSENDPQKLEDDLAALAENKALALYNSHVRGASADEFDSIFGMSKKGGAENPSLNRKFGREAQDIMRKWQVNDPFRVVGRYITSGIKRAELVRRFGNEGEKWSKLSHQMEKDGVPYEVISEMRELTRTAVGVGFPNPGKAAQTFVDSVTLMTAASAMGRGFLNNLVEPITMGMRTGSPIDILRAYAETWARFLREIPALSSTLRAKMGETFWSEYGHEIGTIHNSIEDAWMTTHSMDLDGEYADPRFRWLTNRIYKANLMDASETAKQQASHALGFSFINKLGSMARGDHWTNSLGLNSKQSVADQLSELGINPEDQAEFADWTKKLDAAKIDVRKAMMLGSDKMAKLHQEAMVRFSMQSSVRSNRAHKPEFQDSALGKTYLQLMNFSYSYAAEVNSRMYNMTKQAFAFSPDGKNYSMYDRMRMLGPVAGGMLSILAYRGLLELKDLLYPSESSEKRKKDPEIVKWLNATSYAGLLGPKFEQAMKSIKRDQAIGGPVGQMGVNVARAGKSVFEAAAEGKDMSGAKKSIAKASVPLLKGGIVAGSSAIHPALGTVAAQATNAPAFTNAIVPQDGKKQGGGLTPDTFRLK